MRLSGYINKYEAPHLGGWKPGIQRLRKGEFLTRYPVESLQYK